MGAGAVHRGDTPRFWSTGLRRADATYAMTRAHRQAVVDRYPEFGSKVFVLRLEAGLAEADVADPIGRPEAVYRSCFNKIREALEVILSHENAQSPRP